MATPEAARMAAGVARGVHLGNRPQLRRVHPRLGAQAVVLVSAHHYMNFDQIDEHAETAKGVTV